MTQLASMLRTFTRGSLAAVGAYALATASSVAHAGGVIDVTVNNRAVVSGTLDPASELESFTLDVPEGALVTMVARGIRTSVDVSVSDPNGDPIVLQGTLSNRAGIRATRAPVSISGTYRFDVRARGAFRAGNYSLRVSYTLPRVVPIEGDVVGGLAFVQFAAEKGTVATFDVRSRVRGEGVRLDRVEGPDGFSMPLPAPPRDPAPRHTVRRMTLPESGTYRIFIASSIPDLTVSGRVRLRAPRTPSRLDVRESSRRGGVGDRRIVSRRLDATGGSVDVPRLDPDQLVGVDMSATVVSVPESTIAEPMLFTIATDDDIVQQQGFEPAGVAVTLDAEGAPFAKDVTVTLPFDVGAFPEGVESVGLLKREDDGSITTLALSPDQIDEEKGTVTFPTARFSTFQVYRPALELKEVVSISNPNDLTADETGALFISTDVLTPENPASAIFRIPPGTDQPVLFAGGGVSTGDFVDRLDFDFDGDLGQSGVYLNAIHSAPGGFLIVVTGSLDFRSSVIYVITPDGEVVRFAGDGTDNYVDGAYGPDTGLPYGCGVGQAPDGDILFVTESFQFPDSNLVIKVELDDLSVNIVAGGGTIDFSGFDPLATRLFVPRSITSDSQGRILVGDVDWLVRFDLDNRTTETLAGTNFGETTGGGPRANAAGRRLGGLGAPLTTVVTGQLSDLAFHPTSEDILYAADPSSGVVWRFDLARDRAYIAAGRRLSVTRSLSTRDLPDRDGTQTASSEIRFPVAAQPIGADLFITEYLISRLLVVRPAGD